MAVTVRMTDEEAELLRKAADAIWPDAILTQSAIVLGLAKIGARAILKEFPLKKKA